MSLKAAFISLIANIRAKIATLPPAEQFEANDSAKWVFNEMVWLGQKLDDNFPGLGGDAIANAEVLNKKFDEAIIAVAVAEALPTAVAAAQAEAITKGEVIAKDAHDMAVTAAVKDAKAAGLEEARAEMQKVTAAAESKNKLIAAGVPAAVVEKLPMEVLVGDTAEAGQTKVKERAEKLKLLGFDPAAEAEHFAIVAESFDEAGDQAFAGRISLIEAAKKKAGGGNPMERPNNPNEAKPIRLC